MSEYLDKIRQLRAKAANAASTEAEVETAAMMASKLMAKHGISESDVARAELDHMWQGLHHAAAPQPTAQVQHAVRAAIRGIAYFTETSVHWNTRYGIRVNGRKNATKTVEAVFSGFEGDIEMAFYLCELIRGAAERSWKAYLDLHPEIKEWRMYPRKQRMEAFKTGMGHRVGERLIKMAEERRAAQYREAAISNSTALVVKKMGVVDAYVAEKFPTLTPSRARGRNYDMVGLYAGIRAGDKLNLNRPLSAGANNERIR